MTTELSYQTLLHAQQVLARQKGHTAAIADYLRAEGGIHESTGLVLCWVSPLAHAALELGAQAAGLTGELVGYAADQLQRTVEDYVEADLAAHQAFARLAGRIGVVSSAWQDPTSGVGDVGAPVGGAPAGYGESASWWSPQVAAGFAENALTIYSTDPFSLGGARVTAEGVIDAVTPTAAALIDSATRLAGEVTQWNGAATAVAETADPRSYLVPPDTGVNEFQELRWSAGAVLGGIDWVAEQFLGFSILEEVVFKPFAGDYRQMKGAADAWSSVGRAFTAVAENCAGLTSSTMAGWQGEAGTAFRVAMSAQSGAYLGVAAAAESVSGVVRTIALVSQAACVAIGMILKQISERLIRLAAEAAVPVVGWALAAADTVILVQKVMSYVRVAYSIIEGIVSAIDGFLAGKEALVQTLNVLEDLTEYAYRAARA